MQADEDLGGGSGGDGDLVAVMVTIGGAYIAENIAEAS